MECGLTLTDICSTLPVAHGVTRRMAVISVPERQMTILDDCYNANPASMRQALVTVQRVRQKGERLIFVLGDMLELGALSVSRHREIGELVAALSPPPDLVVTIGEDAHLIAAAAAGAGLSVCSFATVATAIPFLAEKVSDYTGPQLVLVKGSRGVHLEEVTRTLHSR
jgi:UDP-N-acetylmuramoyl-tripeptide--D-alanyl-D-alanine ligase